MTCNTCIHSVFASEKNGLVCVRDLQMVDSADTCENWERATGSDDIRTNKQNNSFHLYCRQVAKVMKDGGITQRVVINAMKEGVEIDASEVFIKSLMQVMSEALNEQKHTHLLTKKQMSKLYFVFDRWLGERFGIHVEWPSDEPPLIGERK